ncbi:thioredoxin-like domain-containing protein [uncultured Dokdonia sp.]|uniref:TlpA family protein disulfide reductase n=1 Tax=uncultured Dokdonia sp. TaxID=575653 RepID=UPI00262CAB05|nr:thioredoxin-like domain-containing protein [uncultured Dokdonia sp.]
MNLRFPISILVILFVVSCGKQTTKEKEIVRKKEDLNLSDINLVIHSDIPIDSVWVADIGQKESFFLPYKDTIKVDFQRNLNDLYNVYVHTEGKRIGKQFWLDGEQLLIDLTVEEQQVTVDKVDSSPLYTASLQFTDTYRELIDSKVDSSAIDKFLISEIRTHIDTPLSHAIVGNFLFRNQNHRDKVDNLYRIMRMQTDSLQDHFINNTDRMISILNTGAVQFDQYELGDINDQKTNITLDPSKQYLLDFWFVRCAPCIRDHKRIAKNYTIFEENNIELIGVSRDDKFSIWRNYLEKHEYPWVNVREQKLEKRLTYDLSIWEFPTYALIDHTGSIQARFSSFAQFENYINKK